MRLRLPARRTRSQRRLTRGRPRQGYRVGRPRSAVGADPLSIPELGNHFVGAVLSINSSTTTTQDINADTSLVGSTGRIFAHDDDPITGCVNFTPGPLQVPPGSTLTGCVTFQVPISAQIGSVQFTPTSGAAGSQGGRWSIG